MEIAGRLRSLSNPVRKLLQQVTAWLLAEKRHEQLVVALAEPQKLTIINHSFVPRSPWRSSLSRLRSTKALYSGSSSIGRSPHNFLSASSSCTAVATACSIAANRLPESLVAASGQTSSFHREAHRS